MRPTIPPARPKKNRITSRPMPCMGPAYQTSVLSAQSTAPNRRDHDDDPENRHHKPDDELDGQRSHDNENHSGRGFPHTIGGRAAMGLDLS